MSRNPASRPAACARSGRRRACARNSLPACRRSVRSRIPADRGGPGSRRGRRTAGAAGGAAFFFLACAPTVVFNARQIAMAAASSAVTDRIWAKSCTTHAPDAAPNSTSVRAGSRAGRRAREGSEGQRRSSISYCLDDRFHVGEILLQRAAAGGGQAVFGPRHASLERSCRTRCTAHLRACARGRSGCRRSFAAAASGR